LLILPPPCSVLFPYTTLFRSGHIMLYVSLFVVIVLNATMGLNGWQLWLLGTIVMGLYFTLMPALVYPGTKAITGGEKFSVGHTGDRKSTRLNSSHVKISYAVF